MVGHQVGESPDPGLVPRIRERSIVGGALLLREMRAGPSHQFTRFHVGITIHPAAPCQETLPKRHVTGPQGRVHDQKPGKPIRHVHGEGETQYAAPVLTNQGDTDQVQMLDQCLQCVPVELKGVDLFFRRLVGSAEPEKIRCDGSISLGDKDGDHLSVQIAPCRFPMKAEEYPLGFPGALIHIVHPETFIGREGVHVSGRVREPGQGFKPPVRGSENLFHGLTSYPGKGSSPRAILASWLMKMGFIPFSLAAPDKVVMQRGQRKTMAWAPCSTASPMFPAIMGLIRSG